MEIFNAPSREVCTVRRERTNTPLQALVTLNDVQFVEAARVLAQEALKSRHGLRERFEALCIRLLCRPMQDEEAAVLEATLAELVKHYRGHAEDARALLAEGESPADPALDPAEHAAWTMLANLLMNLDEFLNK
jgi:hypothetical protein